MRLAVLSGLLVVASALLVVRSQSQADCCEKTGAPSECHFLCGSGSFSVLSLKTWRCLHQHGAAVATCKINHSIDYVKLFGERFSQTMQEGFNTIVDAVKVKITDLTKFATATVKELEGVPQDILSALDTLRKMTVAQFRGLIARLEKFTTQNLRYLLDRVPIDTVADNYGELAKRTWDHEQLSALASTAFRKFGENVGKWTAEQLSQLGNLVAGLPSSELALISATAFDRSVTWFCQVKLSIHQRSVLIIPAESALGKIAYWDMPAIKRMCNLVEAMTPDQLLQLGADNVVAALKDLEKLALDGAQRRALVAKFKESVGKAATWTVDNLKQLGTFIADLDPSDLKEIASKEIKEVLDTLGDLEWSQSQAVVLLEKVKELIGEPDKWIADDMKRLKKILASLAPTELEKLRAKELWQSFQSLHSVQWTKDQALVVFDKIKDHLPQVTKDDLASVLNVIDAIESSDVAKIANVVLLFTFPKAFIAKTVSVCVIRQLLQVYIHNSKDDIVTPGSIAVAFTRAELNETQVADIIGLVGKILDVEWEEDQLAELFMKVRKHLGDLDTLEMAQTDNPNWGFKQLQQLGKLVLGFTTEDLEKFPIRGFEDSVEAMGQQEGWKRGQVIALIKRMREYWKMQNMTVDKLQAVDIATLGSFVQGLTKSEVEGLPEKLLLVAIQQLGQTTGLPEDKLKSRAYTAFNFLHKQTGYNMLNGSDIQSLGNLVVGLGKDAYTKISKDAFLSNVYDIVRKPGMPLDKLRDIVDVAKDRFDETDMGQWLGEQWRQLGPAVKAMDVQEIAKISKGAFDDVIDELGVMDGWTAEQAKAIIGKAKEYWNEEDVGKWTGEQLRRLGAFVQGLDAREIAKIATNAYDDMMGKCAHIRGMESQTLQALAQRGKEVFASGDVSQLSVKHLKQLGCAVTGLLPTDLSKLNVNSIDAVAELGKHADWTKEQVKTLAQSAQQFFKTDFQNDYLLSLGNLIRGYTPDEIEAIAVSAFKQGAGAFGKIADFTQQQLTSLAKKAKETWGVDVAAWSRAQISEAGTFIAGLSREDISKLANDVIEMINPRALMKMTKEQLSGFTPEQLRRLDSTQIRVLTNEQRSYLNGAQTAALRAAEDDDPVENDPWKNAGHMTASSTKLSIVMAIATLVSLFKIIF